MRLHEFGFFVIILLLLTCIIILCGICSMKVYKLLYGRYDKEHALPYRSHCSSSKLNNTLDPRLIQTRIKFFRKPYKRMKESQARNMPPIVEVTTPVDSDAVVDVDTELGESNEKVSVYPSRHGGVTNYWKKDTIIVIQ